VNDFIRPLGPSGDPAESKTERRRRFVGLDWRASRVTQLGEASGVTERPRLADGTIEEARCRVREENGVEDKADINGALNALRRVPGRPAKKIGASRVLVASTRPRRDQALSRRATAGQPAAPSPSRRSCGNQAGISNSRSNLRCDMTAATSFPT